MMHSSTACERFKTKRIECFRKHIVAHRSMTFPGVTFNRYHKCEIHKYNFSLMSCAKGTQLAKNTHRGSGMYSWMPREARLPQNIVSFISVFLNLHEVKCISQEKASDQVKLCSSSTVCVAHLCEAVWSKRVRHCCCP